MPKRLPKRLPKLLPKNSVIEQKLLAGLATEGVITAEGLTAEGLTNRLAAGIAEGIAGAPDNPYNTNMWQRWLREQERDKKQIATFAQKHLAESLSQQVEQARRAIAAQAFVVENRAALISELATRLRSQVKPKLDGFLMLRGAGQGDGALAQNAERLRFFSGFSGSYGWAIFDFRAKKKSVLASDSRYRLQLRAECDSSLFEFIEAPLKQIAETMTDMFPSSSYIGYDPWQVSQKILEEMQEGIQGDLDPRTAKLKLVPIYNYEQKIDARIEELWQYQPPLPISLLSLRKASETGETPNQRMLRIGEQLQNSLQNSPKGNAGGNAGGEASDASSQSLLLTTSTACAWGLSLRASDIPFLPVALGFALLDFAPKRQAKCPAPSRTPARTPARTPSHTPARARFFTSARPTLASENLSHCEILPSSMLNAALLESAKQKRIQKRVLVLDKNSVASALVDTCKRAGIALRFSEEPTEILRRCKTARERRNIRTAHLWDGIALVRFFAWLEQVSASNRRLDEYEASRKLYAFRLQSGKLLDESFKTISASGANAAQIHYPTPREGAKLLQRGKPYLIDSGGQYTLGTTDITRTLIFGEGRGTVAFREAYTAVLRGHIALASATFPEGTLASALDVLARRYLWQKGLDYPHATGHGVGFCLSVHEGKARIAPSGGGEVLQLGMILSNEPGFYSPRNFGIRTENLMEVVSARGVNSEQKRCLSPIHLASIKLSSIKLSSISLAFHTLSLAPIACAPIILEQMEAAERLWLDGYHARVRATIAPYLQETHERNYLKQATEPLGLQ